MLKVLGMLEKANLTDLAKAGGDSLTHAAMLEDPARWMSGGAGAIGEQLVFELWNGPVEDGRLKDFYLASLIELAAGGLYVSRNNEETVAVGLCRLACSTMFLRVTSSRGIYARSVADAKGAREPAVPTAG